MELSFLALRLGFAHHVQEHDAGCANSVWLDLGPSMSPEPTTILEGITPSRQHAASAMGTPSLCGNLKRITLNQQKRDCTLARARTHTKERNKSHHSCTAPKLTQTMNGDGGFEGPFTAPIFFIVKLCCFSRQDSTLVSRL